MLMWIIQLSQNQLIPGIVVFDQIFIPLVLILSKMSTYSKTFKDVDKDKNNN